jgi:hypothetical protein
VYNKVGDSGDVVIEKQGLSIVDTHGPAIAIYPSLSFHMVDFYSDRNQRFQGGRRQEVRRLVSPGLHHIMSVSSHCKMSGNERHTSTWFSSFLPSPAGAMILCHLRSFRMAIYWDRYPRVATKEMVEMKARGTPFGECAGVYSTPDCTPQASWSGLRSIPPS